VLSALGLFRVSSCTGLSVFSCSITDPDVFFIYIHIKPTRIVPLSLGFEPMINGDVSRKFTKEVGYLVRLP
jgi:hypothetical protein